MLQHYGFIITTVSLIHVSVLIGGGGNIREAFVLSNRPKFLAEIHLKCNGWSGTVDWAMIGPHFPIHCTTYNV